MIGGVLCYPLYGVSMWIKLYLSYKLSLGRRRLLATVTRLQYLISTLPTPDTNLDGLRKKNRRNKEDGAMT